MFITEANATIQKMNTESASGVSAAVGAAEAESRQLREELAILHKVVAGKLILRSYYHYGTFMNMALDETDVRYQTQKSMLIIGKPNLIDY